MSFHKKVMWVVVLFGRKGGTGMIEILKEESLEEREKRRLAGKQQMAVKKQDRESKDRESEDKEYKNKDKEYKDREGKENRNREKELLLPKNIRQVGDAGEYTKVYFEDYVMTYIKQQAAFGKEQEDILIFYGDKRKINGKTYYFVCGALKVEEVNSCLYPILFNQEDWKDINECARQFFSGFAVLGWALLCEGEDLELKTRILETQEEFFGEEQPVFMEYIKSEKEEKVYLYHRGKMNLQTGHYIYYDKNEKMQNYMIHEKENIEKVEEESVDHAARQFRMVVQGKQEEKKRKRTNLLLYTTAITLAIVVMLIGITLLGNYEKMENMEKFLYEMAEDATQKDSPVNTLDDNLNAIETNKSIAQSELSGEKDEEKAVVQEGNGNPESETIEVVAGGTEQPSSQNETQANADITATNSITEDNAVNQQASTEIEKQTVEVEGLQNQTDENQAISTQETDTQAAQSEETTNQESSTQQINNQEISQQETNQQETNNQETSDQATNDQETNNQTNDQQESAETVAAVEYQTYTIQKGDTLERINYLFYGTQNRIKEICELNQIENRDNIRYGEKIILPY